MKKTTLIQMMLVIIFLSAHADINAAGSTKQLEDKLVELKTSVGNLNTKLTDVKGKLTDLSGQLRGISAAPAGAPAAAPAKILGAAAPAKVIPAAPQAPAAPPPPGAPLAPPPGAPVIPGAPPAPPLGIPLAPGIPGAPPAPAIPGAPPAPGIPGAPAMGGPLTGPANFRIDPLTGKKIWNKVTDTSTSAQPAGKPEEKVLVETEEQRKVREEAAAQARVAEQKKQDAMRESLEKRKIKQAEEAAEKAKIAALPQAEQDRITAVKTFKEFLQTNVLDKEQTFTSKPTFETLFKLLSEKMQEATKKSVDEQSLISAWNELKNDKKNTNKVDNFNKKISGAYLKLKLTSQEKKEAYKFFGIDDASVAKIEAKEQEEKAEVHEKEIKGFWNKVTTYLKPKKQAPTEQSLNSFLKEFGKINIKTLQDFEKIENIIPDEKELFRLQLAQFDNLKNNVPLIYQFFNVTDANMAELKKIAVEAEETAKEEKIRLEKQAANEAKTAADKKELEKQKKIKEKEEKAAQELQENKARLEVLNTTIPELETKKTAGDKAAAKELQTFLIEKRGLEMSIAAANKEATAAQAVANADGASGPAGAAGAKAGAFSVSLKSTAQQLAAIEAQKETNRTAEAERQAAETSGLAEKQTLLKQAKTTLKETQDQETNLQVKLQDLNKKLAAQQKAGGVAAAPAPLNIEAAEAKLKKANDDLAAENKLPNPGKIRVETLKKNIATAQEALTQAKNPQPQAKAKPAPASQVNQADIDQAAHELATLRAKIATLTEEEKEQEAEVKKVEIETAEKAKVIAQDLLAADTEKKRLDEEKAKKVKEAALKKVVNATGIKETKESAVILIAEGDQHDDTIKAFIKNLGDAFIKLADDQFDLGGLELSEIVEAMLKTAGNQSLDAFVYYVCRCMGKNGVFHNDPQSDEEVLTRMEKIVTSLITLVNKKEFSIEQLSKFNDGCNKYQEYLFDKYKSYKEMGLEDEKDLQQILDKITSVDKHTQIKSIDINKVEQDIKKMLRDLLQPDANVPTEAKAQQEIIINKSYEVGPQYLPITEIFVITRLNETLKNNPSILIPLYQCCSCMIKQNQNWYPKFSKENGQVALNEQSINWKAIRRFSDTVKHIINTADLKTERGEEINSEYILQDLLPMLALRSQSLVTAYAFLSNSYSEPIFLKWASGALLWYMEQIDERQFLHISRFCLYLLFKMMTNDATIRQHIRDSCIDYQEKNRFDRELYIGFPIKHVTDDQGYLINSNPRAKICYIGASGNSVGFSRNGQITKQELLGLINAIDLRTAATLKKSALESANQAVELEKLKDAALTDEDKAVIEVEIKRTDVETIINQALEEAGIATQAKNFDQTLEWLVDYFGAVAKISPAKNISDEVTKTHMHGALGTNIFEYLECFMTNNYKFSVKKNESIIKILTSCNQIVKNIMQSKLTFESLFLSIDAGSKDLQRFARFFGWLSRIPQDRFAPGTEKITFNLFNKIPVSGIYKNVVSAYLDIFAQNLSSFEKSGALVKQISSVEKLGIKGKMASDATKYFDALQKNLGFQGAIENFSKIAGLEFKEPETETQRLARIKREQEQQEFDGYENKVMDAYATIDKKPFTLFKTTDEFLKIKGQLTSDNLRTLRLSYKKIRNSDEYQQALAKAKQIALTILQDKSLTDDVINKTSKYIFARLADFIGFMVRSNNMTYEEVENALVNQKADNKKSLLSYIAQVGRIDGKLKDARKLLKFSFELTQLLPQAKEFDEAYTEEFETKDL